MGIVLINIKHYQLLWIVLCNLSAKFTTDGTASTRDHNDLISDELINLIHVYLDRITTKQIFHCNILQGFCGNFICYKLEHAGQILQFTRGFLANIQNVTTLFRRCARNRQIDLFYFVFLNIAKNLVSAANDRNTVNESAPLIFVVINDTTDTVL